MRTPLMHYIGTEVANRREALGMSQKDLAKKCGFVQQSVSLIESAHQSISIKRLYELAEALDCDIKDLLPGSGWYRVNKDKLVERRIILT